MNKTWVRILAIICLLALILPFILTARAADEERYGYKHLQNDNQRAAYKAFAEGVSKLADKMPFTLADTYDSKGAGEAQALIKADMLYAVKMVQQDYPEYFWFDGGFAYGFEGTSAELQADEYKVNGHQVVTANSAALNTAKAQMSQQIKTILAKIPGNASDYEIAHTIHDYLVKNVVYVQVGDHQTAYGALVSGKAVCAGYARAYQMLMMEAGIDCWYVSGQSYDPSGTLVAHAWNLAWLDGKCYYSDATWDDQNGELFHEYLNMSLEEISKTHFTSDPLPASCGHDTYTFFRMSDGKGVCDIREHKDAEAVADCFELRSKNGDQAVFYCTIHYHGEDFTNWLTENVEPIAIALGFVSTYKCELIELGHEHHVTLKGQVREDVQPTTPPTTVTPTEAPKPTQTPTTVPPTTVKPTQAPTTVPPTTVKPTEAPKPTQAPTTVPPTTVKPTEASKPTDAPATVPPTTVKPTEAPATVPATTVKPTEVPTTAPGASTTPGTTNAPNVDTTQKPAVDITVPDVPSDNEGWVADPVVVGVVSLLVAALIVIVVVLRKKKA